MSSRLGAAALLLGACMVDTAKYQGQLYTCDLTSSDMTACGAGWGCYGASRQLGAPDFCAPNCDAGQPDPQGSVCSEGSALRKCSPSASGPCPLGMSCIRTDLIADEGVCLPISTCARSEDCRDPIRSECFSQEMKAVYQNRQSDLKTDALFCIQAGCASHFEACAPGTSCLPVVLGRGLPDVCTPNCDAKKRCPPNFVCSSKFLPSQPSPFCVPGLLGFRCNSRLDCVIGDCELVGGHKVCTTPCTSPADCISYDNANFFFPAAFTCVNQRCLSPSLVLLELCQINHADVDCAAGDACVAAIPDVPVGLGLCLTPCPAGRVCPPKGGFPQNCLDTAGGSYCVIGLFGLPCGVNADCVSGLQCLVPLPLFPNNKLCTVPCNTHADCTNNHLVGQNGYCVGLVIAGAARVCAPKLESGRACVADVQCRSGVCQCDTPPCSTTNPGRCAAAPTTTGSGP